jgi:hypothetical protein
VLVPVTATGKMAYYVLFIICTHYLTLLVIIYQEGWIRQYILCVGKK